MLRVRRVSCETGELEQYVDSTVRCTDLQSTVFAATAAACPATIWAAPLCAAASTAAVAGTAAAFTAAAFTAVAVPTVGTTAAFGIELDFDSTNIVWYNAVNDTDTHPLHFGCSAEWQRTKNVTSGSVRYDITVMRNATIEDVLGPRCVWAQ